MYGNRNFPKERKENFIRHFLPCIFSECKMLIKHYNFGNSLVRSNVPKNVYAVEIQFKESPVQLCMKIEIFQGNLGYFVRHFLSDTFSEC